MGISMLMAATEDEDDAQQFLWRFLFVLIRSLFQIHRIHDYDYYHHQHPLPVVVHWFPQRLGHSVSIPSSSVEDKEDCFKLALHLFTLQRYHAEQFWFIFHFTLQDTTTNASALTDSIAGLLLILQLGAIGGGFSAHCKETLRESFSGIAGSCKNKQVREESCITKTIWFRCPLRIPLATVVVMIVISSAQAININKAFTQ